MEGPNKKRGAEKQGRKEEDIDDQVAEDVKGTWQEADPALLAGRRIVKGARKAAGAAVGQQPPAVSVNWNFGNGAPASAPAQAATPDTPAVTTAAETTQPVTSTQAPESTHKPATPVKEHAPEKEATPVTTPAKEAQATPTKSDTPSKPETPSKVDGTPAKTETPTKSEGTAQKTDAETSSSPAASTNDASKSNPFSGFPTSGFTFTNLPTTPFGNLPAAPFSGFGTSVNPFANTSSNIFGFGQPTTGSIFGPPASKTEKKDEEGEDGGPEDDGSSVLDNLPPPAKVLDKVVVQTGEENDVKVFEVRTKLYEIEEGAYKERGSGQLNLNKVIASGKHRLLLRDINKAIRLNVATDGIVCDLASDTSVRFVVPTGAGKTSTYLAKVGKKDEATELMQKIKENSK